MPITIPDNLPYTPRGIECLRFGARRGGEGIGCCAVDVFQGFSNPPSAERPPLPFFDGDSWTPVHNDDGDHLHMCGTNEEVFLSYLCHGSFTPDPEPDHAFIAILSDEQCDSTTGQEWLRILYREGFEWVGAVSNSVYGGLHPNHIFMLIRNTHNSMEDEELEILQRPPSGWQEIAETPREKAEDRYKELCKIYTRTHGGPNGR